MARLFTFSNVKGKFTANYKSDIVANYALSIYKPIYAQSRSTGFHTVHLRKMVIGLRFALNLPWNATMDILHAQLMSKIA